MFLGLLDPNPLVRGVDPDEDDVPVGRASYKKKNMKRTFFEFLKSMKKVVGSGSISQRYGSGDPDPHLH
jgi:hypothetical protein